MAVLIKGAKMPENCSECFYLNECKPFDERNSTEQAIQLFAIKGRDHNCPLVEIPPHGDLIDVDNLIEDIKELHDKSLAKWLIWLVNGSAVVIESEKDQ